MALLGRHRLLALALVAGAAAGCGLLREHAKPSELAALEPDRRAALRSFEQDRVQAATAWQLATRRREITEHRLAAAEAKEPVPDDLADWAEGRLEAARRQMLPEDEKVFSYCRARFRALEPVFEAEIDAAEAALEAAEAIEAEARRTYRLTVARQERARLAAVMDRVGVEKEERDKEVGRWDEAVADARADLDRALVERRQAQIAAADARKAWLGHVHGFRERFVEPCQADWQLPAPGETLLPAEPAVTNPVFDTGPLGGLEEKSFQPLPATAPAAATAPGPGTAPAAGTEPAP